jgi:hypothetical protein
MGGACSVESDSSPPTSCSSSAIVIDRIPVLIRRNDALHFCSVSELDSEFELRVNADWRRPNGQIVAGRITFGARRLGLVL